MNTAEAEVIDSNEGICRMPQNSIDRLNTLALKQVTGTGSELEKYRSICLERYCPVRVGDTLHDSEQGTWKIAHIRLYGRMDGRWFLELTGETVGAGKADYQVTKIWRILPEEE